MADEQTGMYGYESDIVEVSPFNFGLNAGNTFLTKLEWIPNGGKNNTEQEALEIIFNINGKDKSFRQFPITHGFGKNGEKITDPNSTEFKNALKDFNAIMTHIAHAFISDEAYKAGMSRPIGSFKEFCQVFKSLLPHDTPKRPLDIFLQYQWQPSQGQNRTYLEIPNKMRNGAWLKPAQPGTWTEKVFEGVPKDNDKALWYINEKGEEHPIWKSGWFMKNNNAKQIILNSPTSSESASNAVAGATTANAQAQNAADKPVATW